MNKLLANSVIPGFSRRYSILIVFIFSFVLLSCKHQKKITQSPTNNTKCNIDYKNAKALITHLKSNEFKFEKLNAKLNVEAIIDSTSNTFTISLRIRKDSIIWMSISKLGIEGARVFITKDSVKFINKLNNTYFKGDFTYISKLLNTPLDFEILQSLLVGNSVTFYNEDEKLKPGIDNCQYLLGTIRKNKLRKVMEKGKELKESAQTIYMAPETFKISRILFYEFNPERVFDAHFSSYEMIDSTQLFPLKMNYSVKTQKNINIDITYVKPRLNEEQSFPFKIPENYEQIIYNEK
jgi:hypothetical protein